MAVVKMATYNKSFIHWSIKRKFYSKDEKEALNTRKEEKTDKQHKQKNSRK